MDLVEIIKGKQTKTTDPRVRELEKLDGLSAKQIMTELRKTGLEHISPPLNDDLSVDWEQVLRKIDAENGNESADQEDVLEAIVSAVVELDRRVSLIEEALEIEPKQEESVRKMCDVKLAQKILLDRGLGVELRSMGGRLWL